MPTGVPLPDDVLHRAIWEKADRRGVVKLDQKALCAELNVTKFMMSRRIRSFIESGRLRQLSSKGNARGKFVVVDPDTWVDPNAPSTVDAWLKEGD